MTHYQQQRRAALAPADRTAERQAKLEARFWSKVDMSGECWEWMAYKDRQGYPRFPIQEQGSTKSQYAHRAAYELVKGAIPEGMHIDHMCHNPGCVNPDHLRAVTHKQNHENRKGASSISATGVRGVHKSPVTGRYRAIVVHNRKAHSCGEFDTIEEANVAVTAKRNELFTHNDTDRTAA